MRIQEIIGRPLLIDFDYGAQEDPKRLALVNNPNPYYNAWDGIWNIGTLVPGASESFELEVFVLAAASPSTTLIAELKTVDQVDINPLNNLSLSTIYVDEEATVLGGSLLSNSIFEEKELSIKNIFPNPSSSKITVAINNPKSQNSMPLKIFDSFGKLVYSNKTTLLPGQNFLHISVDDFPEGIYLIVLSNGGDQNLEKRFIKIKNKQP